MSESFIADQDFDPKHLPQPGLMPGDYENCRFTGLDFSGQSLGGMHFIDCRFTDCDLSNTLPDAETSFRDVLFEGCKLQGIVFADCNHFLFSVAFKQCILRYCSFHHMKLRKIRFVRADLQEADFTGSDLSESVFEHCDLKNAHFEHTNLEKADLRTSIHYSIDPELNKLRKARFSLPAVIGLLDKYEIDIE